MAHSEIVFGLFVQFSLKVEVGRLLHAAFVLDAGICHVDRDAHRFCMRASHLSMEASLKPVHNTSGCWVADCCDKLLSHGMRKATAACF